MPKTHLSSLLLGLALFAAPVQAQQSTPPQVVDPAWMKVDVRTKRVTWELIAGQTPFNGALNFNGFKDGELTFVVPAGWTVVFNYVNRDGNLAHSAEVIADSFPLPLRAVDPVIPKAYTAELEAGASATDPKEVVRFTASPPGSYIVFCAVPGHGLAGMWVRLRIDSTATAPRMVVTPKGAERE